MARDEIATAFRDQSRGEDRIIKVVTDLRKAQHEAAKGRPSSLWLRLVPSEKLEIDFHNETTKKEFREWLTDPTTTGNRRTGWKFVHNLAQPKLVGNLLTHGEDHYWKTEIGETGQVTFTLTRDDLYWKGNDSDPRDLFPYALIEFPVSVLRFMAAILGRYGRAQTNLQVVAGFFISGIRGWRLRPGSPQEPARPWAGTKIFEEDVLEIDPEQLVFSADKLRENPDQCGLRLVRLIYGAFGFESDAIPPEFDQQEGVLRLG